MELEESRNGVCIRTLVANISGSSDWIRAVSSLFDSPCLGLYRRKEILSIGSLDAEIFASKDRVRILENPLSMLTGLYHVIGDVLVPSLQNGVFWSWLSWFRPSSVLVSWVKLGRQVVSNKSSSTLLRLLLLYYVYFVLVVLVKIVILGFFSFCFPGDN